MGKVLTMKNTYTVEWYNEQPHEGWTEPKGWLSSKRDRLREALIFAATMRLQGPAVNAVRIRKNGWITHAWARLLQGEAWHRSLLWKDQRAPRSHPETSDA